MMTATEHRTTNVSDEALEENCLALLLALPYMRAGVKLTFPMPVHQVRKVLAMFGVPKISDALLMKFATEQEITSKPGWSASDVVALCVWLNIKVSRDAL